MVPSIHFQKARSRFRLFWMRPVVAVLVLLVCSSCSSAGTSQSTSVTPTSPPVATPTPIPPIPSNSLLETVSMISPNEGWAVGGILETTPHSGTILHYRNGKWIPFSRSDTPFLTSVVMLSSDDGWIVGEDGMILHYTGSDWTSIDSSTTKILYGLAMVSATEGWAVGEGGTILHYSGWQVGPRNQSYHAVIEQCENDLVDGWLECWGIRRWQARHHPPLSWGQMDCSIYYHKPVARGCIPTLGE